MSDSSLEEWYGSSDDGSISSALEDAEMHSSSDGDDYISSYSYTTVEEDRGPGDNSISLDDVKEDSDQEDGSNSSGGETRPRLKIYAHGDGIYVQANMERMLSQETEGLPLEVVNPHATNLWEKYRFKEKNKSLIFSHPIFDMNTSSGAGRASEETILLLIEAL